MNRKNEQSIEWRRGNRKDEDIEGEFVARIMLQNHSSISSFLDHGKQIKYFVNIFCKDEKLIAKMDGHFDVNRTNSLQQQGDQMARLYFNFGHCQD